MQSDLELLIRYDMYINGYDPDDVQQVQKYWEERLS
jgi:hypothetical protein